jgi:menaquinone-dependent protoporphyrinogen oxidase
VIGALWHRKDDVNVLIAYGTTEGQTRKIAEWAATYIRERSHPVELYDSADLLSNLNLNEFQAFVLAASVHQEQHQGTIKNFATAHREILNIRPSAFISVSLSAVLEDTRPEAQKYVDRFMSLTGWRPHVTLLLGGALRFAEYDYFQEQILKFIVMKRGVASNTGLDREFTDWSALAGFLDEFLRMAARHCLPG